MKLTQTELAEMMFKGFSSHWDFLSCEKVAGAILEKMDEPDEPEPVIEVGDVVKWIKAPSPERERIVTWCRTRANSAMIQLVDDIPDEVNLSDLTLIRKGPKVHTFEGVRAVKVSNGFVLFVSTSDLNEDKRYTITPTEEE